MSSKVTSPVIGLVSGLVVGLMTCEASASGATEELIVYGTTPRTYVSEELLRADMREYVRDLNERLKAAIEKDIEEDLKQLAAPKVHLASGEVATRG